MPEASIMALAPAFASMETASRTADTDWRSLEEAA